MFGDLFVIYLTNKHSGKKIWWKHESWSINPTNQWGRQRYFKTRYKDQYRRWHSQQTTSGSNIRCKKRKQCHGHDGSTKKIQQTNEDDNGVTEHDTKINEEGCHTQQTMSYKDQRQCCHDGNTKVNTTSKPMRTTTIYCKICCCVFWFSFVFVFLLLYAFMIRNNSY